MKKILGLLASVGIVASASTAVVACADDPTNVGSLTLVEGKSEAEIATASGASYKDGKLTEDYPVTKAEKFTETVEGLTVTISYSEIAGTLLDLEIANTLKGLFTETKDIDFDDIESIVTTTGVFYFFAIYGVKEASSFDLILVKCAMPTVVTDTVNMTMTMDIKFETANKTTVNLSSTS